MEFERSTQARSWIFDETSLDECRRQAAMNLKTTTTTFVRPRKFASGFHRRRLTTTSSKTCTSISSHDMTTRSGRISPIVHSMSCYSLSVGEQEALVRFHAHQLSSLVGPDALLPELRCSRAALSTAITLFRRFYLSNSITEFCPRRMAAASAFLGSKVEDCKISIGILSHATSIIHLKFKADPLYSAELCGVSIVDIETAEKLLLEGLNYELRCHHPHNAIRVLVSDFSTVLSEIGNNSHHDYHHHTSGSTWRSSPQTASLCPDDLIFDLHEEAVTIAQTAMVFSDVAFLFPPGQIAFAAVSMAVGGTDAAGRLGPDMQTYLRRRFAKRLPQDVLSFERQVARIIRMLQSSFAEFGGGRVVVNNHHNHYGSNEAAAMRAQELGHVLEKVSILRSWRNQPITTTKMTNHWNDRRERKRLRPDFTAISSSRCDQVCYKVPRVTPTRLS